MQTTDGAFITTELENHASDRTFPSAITVWPHQSPTTNHVVLPHSTDHLFLLDQTTTDTYIGTDQLISTTTKGVFAFSEPTKAITFDSQSSSIPSTVTHSEAAEFLSSDFQTVPARGYTRDFNRSLSHNVNHQFNDEFNHNFSNNFNNNNRKHHIINYNDIRKHHINHNINKFVNKLVNNIASRYNKHNNDYD
ncbi:UNVERIFIED_CONTAM: hypothetical protein HDU68_009824 [Siphonaria sp. JEL0065]|nr:hypothetical protein HDU68_009824 [Siphonaria sp. JEL0065]